MRQDSCTVGCVCQDAPNVVHAATTSLAPLLVHGFPSIPAPAPATPDILVFLPFQLILVLLHALGHRVALVFDHLAFYEFDATEQFVYFLHDGARPHLVQLDRGIGASARRPRT